MACATRTINIDDNYESIGNTEQVLVISDKMCWLKGKKDITCKPFLLEDLKKELKFDNDDWGYTTSWVLDNLEILKALGYELSIKKIQK